jgi:hypothetical protein
LRSLEMNLSPQQLSDKMRMLEGGEAGCEAIVRVDVSCTDEL